MEQFPLDLWKRMGKAGLLGLYLPRAAGGGGGGAGSAELVVAGEAFVRAGGNLGMASAWFGHSVVARFLVAGFGSKAQKTALLPELAAGRVTASVAISEPGAGAHPKHLAASAERQAGGFVLNGEKVYVTNGMFASVFVVVAITKMEEGRKRFSAFLVPRDSEGLTVEAMPPLDLLRPSQHVRLLLPDRRLERSAMLGKAGRGGRASDRSCGRSCALRPGPLWRWWDAT